VSDAQLSAALVSYAAEEPGGWTAMLDTARLYDRAGIDRLVISDHVVFGEQLDAYGNPATGGTRGGKQPTGPDGHWLEPLTTLSVIAGSTERVRLSTGIILAALRRPVVLAKMASTLDVLSGGRLDLGVGVGWQREEYESPELEFERIHMMPKPLQPGGVPIWVSGTINARVVQRLCRFGMRWIPWGDDAADLHQSIARLREQIEATGAASDALQVVANLRVYKAEDGTMDLERSLEPVPDLIAAGATDLRVRFPVRAPNAESEAAIGDFVSAFRNAAGRS
jgi:alkanesulfonate monooxygenase SsuD/methylene tetrahydromethanopterin reductase-like flavin-dependent oxidoreductase (luciferase family)